MSYEIRKRKDGQRSVKFYCTRNGVRTPSETWAIPDDWSEAKVKKEISRRDADYCARVDRGEPVGNEHKKQVTAEAETRIEEQNKRDNGPTFREYTADFLKHKSVELQPTTIKGYRSTFNHACKALGDYKLTEISEGMIRNYLNDLREDNGLEFRTYKNRFLQLKSFFDSAAEEGIIEKSPMEDMKLPRSSRKLENARKDAENVYTLEEVWHILNCMESDSLRNRALITFMLDSGCRRGEVLGLKWRDVDFENQRVNICNNIEYDASRGTYETSPKNGKSRVITLASETLNVMKELQDEQRSTVTVIPDKDYCFHGKEVGKPMSPSYFNALFDRIAARHGFEDFRPHKLRHTSATLLIVEGKADIASVSRRLGHSNVSITLNTYCHAYDTAQAQAAETIGNLIHKRNPENNNKKRERSV